MRIEFYKCDICLRKLSKDEGIVELFVPKIISLKQNRIIRKEIHVCEKCYKSNHHKAVKDYEEKLKTHISQFFENHKFYF